MLPNYWAEISIAKLRINKYTSLIKKWKLINSTSVQTVEEFRGVSDEIQKIFILQWAYTEDFSYLVRQLVEYVQKWGIFSFQNVYLESLRPKINQISWKWFLYSNIFLDEQLLLVSLNFEKPVNRNIPNLCRQSLKLSYIISKNPLRIFIWVQNSIEFYLKHHNISQSSAY